MRLIGRRAAKAGLVDRLRSCSVTTVALVVLVAGRLVDLAVGPGPVTLPDTPMYLPIPGRDELAQVSFVGSMPRPWVVTLPYALVESHAALVVLQRVVGVIAWALLVVAVGRAEVIRDPFRRLLQFAVVAIALSPIVTVWDPLLQSDSLAMTGAALLCAGIFELLGRPVRLVRAALLLVAGGLLGALIRPALLTVVVVAAVAVPFVVLRDRDVPDRALALRATAIAAVLVALAGYVFVVNDRIDFAWGKELAGQERLRGRTLQQVGVIGAVPWGNERMRKVAQQLDAPCVDRTFISPPEGVQAVTWRGVLLERCPSDTRRFAEEVDGRYLRGLLSNPRRMLVDLWPALTDAFGPPPPAAETVSLVPASVGDLWTADPRRGTHPLLLWGLVMAVLFAAVALRRGFAAPGAPEACAVLVATVAAGAAGVWLTAALSPLDTYRVASAPAMVTRLGLLGGVALLASRWWEVRTVRTGRSHEGVPAD